MLFRVNDLQRILGCLKNESLIYGWSEQTSLKPAHNSGSFKSKFFCFINSFDEAFMFISIWLHHTISGFRKFKGQVTFLKNGPKNFQRLFCRAFLHETEWSNVQKTSQPTQKFWPKILTPYFFYSNLYLHIKTDCWWLRGMVSNCLEREGKYDWFLREGLLALIC